MSGFSSSADFAHKLVQERQRHTSFQRNNLKICRCVPKLNELYVLYYFRNIAKLACCGSQRIHLKNLPRKYLYIQILVWWYRGPKFTSRFVCTTRLLNSVMPNLAAVL